MYNLNRAELSRYHRVSKREREQSHVSAPVIAGRPALSRERKRNSTAHKQHILTCSAPLQCSHTPTLRMYRYQPVTQSVCLISRPAQINKIQPSLVLCSGELFWKEVCEGRTSVKFFQNVASLHRGSTLWPIIKLSQVHYNWKNPKIYSALVAKAWDWELLFLYTLFICIYFLFCQRTWSDNACGKRCLWVFPAFLKAKFVHRLHVILISWEICKGMR